MTREPWLSSCDGSEAFSGSWSDKGLDVPRNGKISAAPRCTHAARRQVYARAVSALACFTGVKRIANVSRPARSAAIGAGDVIASSRGARTPDNLGASVGETAAEWILADPER